MSHLDLIATSTMGLEAVVSRELTDLGFEPKILDVGQVFFQGDAQAICRANLWLRCAGRVLVRLDQFEATDFGTLFDRTAALPWEEWIPPDGRFPVNGRSVKSDLSSVPACQKIVKKAIVERLLGAHRVSSLDETGPTVTVEVALRKNLASLTIDTSGSGLHRRGYRALAAPAQLRETLAAALVDLSFWKPERPLIDPFCGSGTILIEAARIGRKMAPGLDREFAAEKWPALATELWQRCRDEAREQTLPNLPERIMGFDRSSEALSLARYHAKLAGVADDIHFQEREFSRLTTSRQFGCLIANPPYGRRLGEAREMDALYHSFPDVLRRLKTWSHFILTAYPNFESVVGQPADRRRKLYNGRIECTYFQFHGPRPNDAPREAAERSEDADRDRDEGRRRIKPQPVFGGVTDKGREQAELFQRRLAKRAHHLRRWPTRRGITCYRLYERDIPEIPLVVDRYEECLHISEYERPHDRTPAQHADWLDLMARTAAETLELPLQNVFLKRRRRQKGAEQHERVAELQKTFVVHEGGLKFEVNLSDYVDSGLFLDHRITRGMVRDEAAGRRVLNLFGYTGAFTVYAAAGQARQTTTVDLSQRYLDWALRNLQLNELAGPAHQGVCSDAMGFLENAALDDPYDLAIVDPPTFSNSKRLEDFWDVQRDHVRLLNSLLPRMTSGGVVYFSTNFRRFKLSEADIEGVAIREISRQTVPEDFRNRRIHRCWRMVKA